MKLPLYPPIEACLRGGAGLPSPAILGRVGLLQRTFGQAPIPSHPVVALAVKLVVCLIWAAGVALELPPFNEDGLLPPGDYEMSLEELKGSMLVEGLEEGYPNWDSGWRTMLLENLEVMVGQLRRVGITQIFVNRSFVEDKDHPNDIDGYSECDVVEFANPFPRKPLFRPQDARDRGGGCLRRVRGGSQRPRHLRILSSRRVSS